MSKEEIIKEAISILETSNYVDPAEHLYDGLKQINREITYDTVHNFLWALESSTVIDVDGKVGECAKKIKQLLQQELLDEVYENWLMNTKKMVDKEILKKFIQHTPNIHKEEFINKYKTDPEFSEKWGLKIEERELSLEERKNIWLLKNSDKPHLLYHPGMVEKSHPLTTPQDWFDEHNIPTKLITMTYNDKTIESYE